MDTQERRNLLLTAPNPNPRLDYVAALDGHLSLPSRGDPAAVGLLYVPDKLILDTAAFGRYLKAIEAMDWQSLEQVAVTILDDVDNEAVARWVQVALSDPDPAPAGIARHAVLVEDRQPSWDNPPLLSRLRRF